MVIDITWYGIIIFFFTAFAFSMVGLGGGSVYAPILNMMGHDIKAVGVPGGNFLVFITAFSSSINYIRKKLVNYKMAFAILLGTIPTSFLVQNLFYQKASFEFIWILLVSVVLISGVKSLLFSDFFSDFKLKKEFYEWLVGFFTGIVAGFISFVTSIGGGFLMVPVLMQISYEPKKAGGTSAFVILFTSGINSIIHFVYNFNQDYTSNILVYSIAAFAGGLFGSHVSIDKFQSHHVKKLIGIILTIIGGYLFIKKFLIGG